MSDLPFTGDHDVGYPLSKTPTGGDERRHVICLCPDCVKQKGQTPQPMNEAQLLSGALSLAPCLDEASLKDGTWRQHAIAFVNSAISTRDAMWRFVRTETVDESAPLTTIAYMDGYADGGKSASMIVDKMVDALQGVIRVADRDTDEFNAARVALQRAAEWKDRIYNKVDKDAS